MMNCAMQHGWVHGAYPDAWQMHGRAQGLTRMQDTLR